MADSDIVSSLVDQLGLAGDTATALKAKLADIDSISFAEIQKRVTEFTKSHALAKEAVESLTKGLKELSQLKDPFTFIDNLTEANQNFIDNIKKGGEDFKNTLGYETEGLEEFGEKMVGALVIPNAVKDTSVFDSIGGSAKNNQYQLEGMANTFAQLTGHSSAWAQNILHSADANRNFERSYLNLASETGHFSQALGAAGDSFQNSERTALGWNQAVTETAAAAGMSAERVGSLYAQLQTIPGALDEMGSNVSVGSKALGLFDASLKVAAGSGQDAGDVMSFMSQQVSELGGSTKLAVEEVAEMSVVSDKLNLPFKTLQGYVRDTSNTLREFGNNAEGNLKIVSELAPALEKVGVSNQMVGEISKSVVDGISNMTTAQKAFISAQTGGPGGLRGAAQIDLLLEQGKTEEVFGKIKQNLNQQFGGKFVTRTEAAQSEEAAGQFQKQIMFLTGPAGGGIAKDERTAAKLLEAMQSGLSDIPESLKSPQIATDKVLNQGIKLQERANSYLASIDAMIKSTGSRGSVAAGELTRKIGGNEDKGMEALQRDMKDRLQNIKGLNPLLGKGEKQGLGFGEDVGRGAAETVSDLRTVGGTVKERLSNLGSAFSTGLGTNKDEDTRRLFNKKSPRPNVNEEIAGEVSTATSKETTNAKGEKVIVIDQTIHTVCDHCMKETIKKESHRIAGDAVASYDKDSARQIHSPP